MMSVIVTVQDGGIPHYDTNISWFLDVGPRITIYIRILTSTFTHPSLDDFTTIGCRMNEITLAVDHKKFDQITIIADIPDNIPVMESSIN